MQLMFGLLGVVILISSGVAPSKAQTIECGAEYTVQEGDSLSMIAGRAYGRTTAYQPIFDYNPGKMPSANELRPGISLYIPCIEDVENSSLSPLSEAEGNDLKILTGSEYPPYVDAGLPGGGFSFELLERALQANGGEADYRVDVINDWPSHLRILLADGAYDLGFPWFQPNCDNIQNLGEESRWKCNNLLFSDVLHEVVVSFYARSETAANLREPTDMHDMTLCRPRGYFTHDLEEMDLMPPQVIRVAGANPTECFERLIDGEIDVVTVNADTADRVLTELGIAEDVEDVLELATVQSLHVVGMRTDPDTRIHLLRVNQGIRTLHDSGTFQQLAAKHLAH